MSFADASGPESVWRSHAGSEMLGPDTGHQTRFVAPGSVTGGEFGLFEIGAPAGRLADYKIRRRPILNGITSEYRCAA